MLAQGLRPEVQAKFLILKGQRGSRTIAARPTPRQTMTGLKDIDYVLGKLAWMRAERIWPNGLRYLWTDAFGLVLLVSFIRS